MNRPIEEKVFPGVKCQRLPTKKLTRNRGVQYVLVGFFKTVKKSTATSD
jgi:hypothetical protein